MLDPVLEDKKQRHELKSTFTETINSLYPKEFSPINKPPTETIKIVDGLKGKTKSIFRIKSEYTCEVYHEVECYTEEQDTMQYHNLLV